MKIKFFTPTKRFGGIDVNYDSILRQEGLSDHEVSWLIVDDLYSARCREVANLPSSSVRIDHRGLGKKDGDHNNLATAYNYALDLCKDEGVDLLISLQDYIYLPDDALLAGINFVRNFDGSIATCLCSHYDEPDAFNVVDLEGKISIFDRLYFESSLEPFRKVWNDIRGDHIVESISVTDPVRFETNLAFITDIVINSDVRFNEFYNAALAHENQDFAMSVEAELSGKTFLINTVNAKALPHYKYFDESVDGKIREFGMLMHHKRHGLSLPDEYDLSVYDGLEERFENFMNEKDSV